MPPEGARHVHVMVLSGFRSDVFTDLLDGGQLPHFAFLLARGRLSTQATSVDRSETARAFEALLSARRETAPIGPWQFDRASFRFRNPALDPADGASLELGLESPPGPTVFDALAAEGRTGIAGPGVPRRGAVSGSANPSARLAAEQSDYGRDHAAISALAAQLERLGKDPSAKLPALSVSWLTAADEQARSRGVVNARDPGAGMDPESFCVERATVEPEFERLFKLIDDDRDGALVVARHFLRVEHETEAGKVARFCFRLPRVLARAADNSVGPTSIGPALEEFADPRYVAALIHADIQLGRLIHALRSVRLQGCEKGAARCLHPPAREARGVAAYAAAGKLEGSLLENTLFIAAGDHGVSDTKYMMAPESSRLRAKGRHAESHSSTLVDAVGAKLGLAVPAREKAAEPDQYLGVSESTLPADLFFPHKTRAWQSPEVRKAVGAASRWALGFFEEIRKDTGKEAANRRFWTLLFPGVSWKADRSSVPYQDRVVDSLARIHLRGDPAYVKAETEYLRGFYAKHVRLVHGGGGGNGAELFLPAPAEGGATWDRRPTYAELASDQELIDAIKSLPSVGLVFMRKQDPIQFLAGQDLEIRVFDRFGNEGLIVARRPKPLDEPTYSYSIVSGGDPLGTESTGEYGRFLTYDEWNDLSAKHGHAYRNAVAGMGSYLLSANPAIGDITLTAAQGWSFGDQPGGHGGLQDEEKRTIMLVSGPGVEPGGDLMARSKALGRPTHPTPVDVAPTALEWLGLGSDALERLGRGDAFPQQLKRRAAEQAKAYADELLAGAEAALKEAGAPLPLARHRERFRRLFQSLERAPPMAARDPAEYRTDGNRLLLK